MSKSQAPDLKGVSEIAAESRKDAEDRSKLVYAFFFVLIVTWISLAVDLSAGSRGSAEKRIYQAADAATVAYQVCRFGGADCIDKVKELKNAMGELNSTIDFVLFKLGDISLAYQAVFIYSMTIVIFIIIYYGVKNINENLIGISEEIKGKNYDLESLVKSTPFPAPYWFLPFAGRNKDERLRELVDYLELKAKHKPAQKFIGYCLIALPVLMTSHAVWIHCRFAFRTIGTDFKNFSPGQAWGRLAEFRDELPYSMAFTGMGWLDTVLLTGGLVFIYALLDHSFALPTRPTVERSGAKIALAIDSLEKRAFLVGVLVAGVVASDMVSRSGKRLLAFIPTAKVPRYMSSKTRFASLGLPTGLYENPRSYRKKPEPTYHFVRPDGTAQDLFEMAVRDHLGLIDLNSISDFSKIPLGASVRSEATESLALGQLNASTPNRGAAIRILSQSLLASRRDFSSDRKVDFRIFDLAAGLSRRYDIENLRQIELVAKSFSKIVTPEEREKLAKRLQKWNDPQSKWSKKWANSAPITWDKIDIA